MSKASIEQALMGLVPTLSGPLPPELVELALSLLARSRSVAHSLKPDEEIARPYACAQLACERLKKRLNLPTITPRPPCPPRIYKKLYIYLESALPGSSTPREPQTPRKSVPNPPASARTTPKTPLSGAKTPRSARREDTKGVELPTWTAPTIRALLKEFSYPNAAGHIYTGVEVILPLLARMSAAGAETPSKRPRRAAAASQQQAPEVPESRILGLIAVIFLFVLSRMWHEDITPEQYSEWRSRATAVLLASLAGKHVLNEDLTAEIDHLMPLAQEEGWLQMEWFVNVQPPSAEDGEGAGVSDAAPALASGKRGLRDRGSTYIGLGTMLQDATDYLGEQQRGEYERWKAGILARVEEIEASQ